MNSAAPLTSSCWPDCCRAACRVSRMLSDPLPLLELAADTIVLMDLRFLSNSSVARVLTLRQSPADGARIQRPRSFSCHYGLRLHEGVEVRVC